MSASTDNMFLPLYRELLPTPNRISHDDYRYGMLQTIPAKEYDPDDDTYFVYLRINEEKDYFITLHIRNECVDYYYDDDDHPPDYICNMNCDEYQPHVEIQIQRLQYEGDNRVIWLSGNTVVIY